MWLSLSLALRLFLDSASFLTLLKSWRPAAFALLSRKTKNSFTNWKLWNFLLTSIYCVLGYLWIFASLFARPFTFHKIARPALLHLCGKVLITFQHLWCALVLRACDIRLIFFTVGVFFSVLLLFLALALENCSYVSIWYDERRRRIAYVCTTRNAHRAPKWKK